MKFTTIAATGAIFLSATTAFADSNEASTTEGEATESTEVVEEGNGNDILATAVAMGDPEAGEKVFKKCKACHQVGPDASTRTGPPLNNMIGAVIGSNEDFRYSKTMASMHDAGIVWTIENLDAFLTKPRDFVAKTKMSFSGLRKEDDRANLIAYLATFTEAASE